MLLRSQKIFYGWFIIAASALGICFGYIGTAIYAFSAFTLPLTAEFGWSRGAVSLGMTCAHTTTIVATPLLGILIDKKGVRRPLLISTFLFGCILCLFYFLNQHIWLFYLGMVLLTALGCGTSSVTYVRLLVTWFNRRKGLALALGVSGAGLGALILPPLVSWIIERNGWRDAFLVLGATNLLLVVPVIYLIVRNSPADVNAYPDGELPARDDAGMRQAIGAPSYAFRECLHTTTFWKLAVATLLLGIALNGTVSQIIPLLIDRGVPRHSAGDLASVLGLSVIVARLGTGYLLDRFHAPFVAAGLLICPVFGFLGLAMMPGEKMAALTLVSFGIGLGLEFDALGYFCVQYFGHAALGRIYATLFVLFSVGGAAGSYLAGYSYDVFSSYTLLLFCGAVATFIAVAFIASLGDYPRPMSRFMSPPRDIRAREPGDSRKAPVSPAKS
ncbi:MAG: MFS transporter [Steroidobacteraceae bacterium]